MDGYHEVGTGTTAARRWPRALAAVVLAVGVVVGVVVGGGAPVPVAAQTPASGPPVVSTTFTLSAGAPGCATFPFEVTHSAGSTAQAFQIRITIARRLCAPIGATAAVYTMPSYSTAWPQTLFERQVVTLQEPGTYVVSFAKGCSPQQFDLIAGTAASVTPPVVSPTGPWHGPLLFPLDLGTSLQWRGCGPDPVIPEFPAPVVALGLGAAVTGGALWWRRRHGAAAGTPA